MGCGLLLRRCGDNGAAVGSVGDRLNLTANINGVSAAHVLGGSVTYANNPEEDASINGTPYASGYLLDQDATASGAMQLRYVDETYFDLMTAGDPVAIELEFGSAADAKIVFALPAVRFEKGAFAPISGPGGLQADLNWRGEQSAAAAMMSVTVTNQIASYA